MEKDKIIEDFLEKLGTSSNGKFFIVCGKCGQIDNLTDKDSYGDDDRAIEQEITGAYSDYTGHLWDTVNIKCIPCGNAVSFKK